MANTFKNAKLALTTTLTDVYTCPAATTAVITLVQVANIDGTANAEIDVVWTDASDANSATYLAKTIVVPADASYSALGGRLALEAGDKIQAKADAINKAQITVSVLELT